MPQGRRQKADQARRWLPRDGKSGGAGRPAPSSRPAPKSGAVDPAEEVWIPAELAAGDSGDETRSRDREPPSKPRSRRNGVSLLRGQREARLLAKVKRANLVIASKDEEIRALRDRVRELEGELDESPPPKPRPAGKKPKGGKKVRTKAKPKAKGTPRRKRAAKRPAAKRSAKKPDLNELSFEDLRDLGLSVTQSARLAASREFRRGFSSLDELDELPGFGRQTIADLKQQVRIS